MIVTKQLQEMIDDLKEEEKELIDPKQKLASWEIIHLLQHALRETERIIAAISEQLKEEPT